MTPKDLGTLLIVSMLWGGSFLLMRIVVPSLGPIMVAETRVLLAGLALTAFATAIGTKLEFGLRWRQYLILGALNGALPFALISAAELHMTASTAAILNATTPLFGALIAAIWKVEVFTVQRFIGLTTGFVGVAVLVGWNPSQWTAAWGWSVLASLVAAAGYGAVSVYTKRNIQDAAPLALAAGSQLAAAILLLPLIPIVPPTMFPTRWY